MDTPPNPIQKDNTSTENLEPKVVENTYQKWFSFAKDQSFDLQKYLEYLMIFFVLYNTIWYFHDKSDQDKCSQILTIINSANLSVMFFVYMFTKNTAYPAIGVASFTITNILELVYGPIYYPTRTSILTTYLHHICYLCFAYYYIQSGIMNIATFLFFAEIPTFLLGIRNYFGIRNIYFESSFGITFLITRVLFWGWIAFSNYDIFKKDNIVISSFGLTLVLHVYWFGAWLIKFVNRYFIPKNNDFIAPVESPMV